MKLKLRALSARILTRLQKIDFRVGIWLLAGAGMCYIISFAQMSLPNISVVWKGILWTCFFGLAKTLQYTAMAVLGTDGISRLKKRFRRNRKKN